MTYAKERNKLIIPRADKDSEQLEFSCTTGGTRNKNSTATLKNGLESSYKVKYMPIHLHFDLAILIPGIYLSKRNANLCPQWGKQRHLYKKVHNNLFIGVNPSVHQQENG